MIQYPASSIIQYPVVIIQLLTSIQLDSLSKTIECLSNK